MKIGAVSLIFHDPLSIFIFFTAVGRKL